MKHYKDSNNNIYAFELDGSQDAYIKDGMIAVSDEELAILRAPTVADLKAAKQREIDALEAGQYMTRGEREGWIAMVLAQASAQSVPEPTLYLANSFYKKLKDVNTQVTLLRAELKAIV